MGMSGVLLRGPEDTDQNERWAGHLQISKQAPEKALSADLTDF